MTFMSVLIIIIMFLKCQTCFLFLEPQDEVGPSLPRSSYVPSSFWFILQCLFWQSVSIFCTCCSHLYWYCFISFTMFCAPVFLSNTLILFFIPYRKACRSRGIKVAAPPLDSTCDGPVTYPGDTKIQVKSSKGRSGPTLVSVLRYLYHLHMLEYCRKIFVDMQIIRGIISRATMAYVQNKQLISNSFMSFLFIQQRDMNFLRVIPFKI